MDMWTIFEESEILLEDPSAPPIVDVTSIDQHQQPIFQQISNQEEDTIDIMNTHPYYAPNNSVTNRYTQLALLLVSQGQNQNLSREEEEKRRIRRERNKVAATKCREKRKAHSVFVRHEYSRVTEQTKKLEEQIMCLKRERDELSRLLDTHECANPSLGGSQGANMYHQHTQQQQQQQAPILMHPGPMLGTTLTDLFIKTEPHY
eukprot:sb/3470515/